MLSVTAMVPSVVVVLCIAMEELVLGFVEAADVVDLDRICTGEFVVAVVVAVGVDDNLARRLLALALAILSSDLGISWLRASHPSVMGSRKLSSKTDRSALQFEYMHFRTVSRKIPLAALHKHLPFVGGQPPLGMHFSSTQSGKSKFEVGETGRIMARNETPMIARRICHEIPIVAGDSGAPNSGI